MGAHPPTLGPPAAGRGVTSAESDLARLVQAGPVLVIDTPAAETWIWSDLHLRDPGAFVVDSRPFTNFTAMEEAILETWHTAVGPRTRSCAWATSLTRPPSTTRS